MFPKFLFVTPRSALIASVCSFLLFVGLPCSIYGLDVLNARRQLNFSNVLLDFVLCFLTSGIGGILFWKTVVDPLQRSSGGYRRQPPEGGVCSRFHQPFMDVAENSLLKTALRLLALAAAVSALLYVMIWTRLLSNLPYLVAIEFVVVPFLRLLAIYLVWRKAKLGVVTYALVTVADIWVCATFYKFAASLYGVAGTVLLCLVIRRHWAKMRWVPARVQL